MEHWNHIKGFRFQLWDFDGYNDGVDTGRILFKINKECGEEKDLDLLFGGEE